MATFTYRNSDGLTVDNGSTSQSVLVYGALGLITDVRVSLVGLQHEFANEVDMLLVAPDQTSNLVFWSDGPDNMMLNGTYTITDSADTLIPNYGFDTLASGSYRPAAYDFSDGTGTETPATFGYGGASLNFAATWGSSTFASAFGGANPAGEWMLYVHDDVNLIPTVLQQWQLTIATNSDDAQIFGSAEYDQIIVKTTAPGEGRFNSYRPVAPRDDVSFSDVTGTIAVAAGAGDDFVTWGVVGDGVIDGGAGSDFLRFVFDTYTSGLTVVITGDPVTPSGSLTVNGYTPVISNFENLSPIMSFTSFADYIDLSAMTAPSGFYLNLSAGAGDDVVIASPTIGSVISGDDGNDTIYSGSVSSRLNGGTGDDLIVISASNQGTAADGGAGFDTLSFAAARGGVTIDLSIYFSQQSTGGAGNVGVISIEKVIGGAFDDTLTGSDADNVLIGGAGNDRLTGGAGFDLLYGGTGDDDYFVSGQLERIFEKDGEGFDEVFSTIDLRITEAAFPSIEKFWLLGSATKATSAGRGDYVVGNDADNTFIMRGGDDIVLGGLGDDIIVGGTGADYMAGERGDDFYFVDDAGDLIEELFDQGRDTVFAEIDYILPRHVEQLRLFGPAAVNGTGNALDNTIFAGQSPATLRGEGGNDTLIGSQSNDRLFGGDGDDAISGRGGEDELHGGNGNDTLFGDDQSDALYGDAGSDILRGLSGRDMLDGGDGDDLLFGGDQADELRGGSGRDTLRGEDGSDIIDGGADNDFIYGGAGRDILTGGAGRDLFYWDDGEFGGLTSGDADRITDFSQAEGDVLRLNLVDAIAGGEDDAFAFIGNAAFSGTAGELRYEQGANYTLVLGDTDGDGMADLAIRLDGVIDLTVQDFVL